MPFDSTLAASSVKYGATSLSGKGVEIMTRHIPDPSGSTSRGRMEAFNPSKRLSTETTQRLLAEVKEEDTHRVVEHQVGYEHCRSLPPPEPISSPVERELAV